MILPQAPQREDLLFAIAARRKIWLIARLRGIGGIYNRETIAGIFHTRMIIPMSKMRYHTIRFRMRVRLKSGRRGRCNFIFLLFAMRLIDITCAITSVSIHPSLTLSMTTFSMLEPFSSYPVGEPSLLRSGERKLQNRDSMHPSRRDIMRGFKPRLRCLLGLDAPSRRDLPRLDFPVSILHRYDTSKKHQLHEVSVSSTGLRYRV